MSRHILLLPFLHSLVPLQPYRILWWLPKLRTLISKLERTFPQPISGELSVVWRRRQCGETVPVLMRRSATKSGSIGFDSGDATFLARRFLRRNSGASDKLLQLPRLKSLISQIRGHYPSRFHLFLSMGLNRGGPRRKCRGEPGQGRGSCRDKAEGALVFRRTTTIEFAAVDLCISRLRHRSSGLAATAAALFLYCRGLVPRRSCWDVYRAVLSN